MSEWQPMETAPKDGTDILTYGADGFEVLFYSQIDPQWTRGDHRFDWFPTHWMPLPPPPTEKGEE